MIVFKRRGITGKRGAQDGAPLMSTATGLGNDSKKRCVRHSPKAASQSSSIPFSL